MSVPSPGTASRHGVQSRSKAGAFLCADAQSRQGGQSRSMAGAFLGAHAGCGVQPSSMAGALYANAQSGHAVIPGSMAGPVVWEGAKTRTGATANTSHPLPSPVDFRFCGQSPNLWGVTVTP